MFVCFLNSVSPDNLKKTLPTPTESGGGGRRQEKENDFYVHVIHIFNRYSAKMLNIDTKNSLDLLIQCTHNTKQ